MNQIKVGFLLSYDYEYLKVAIPRVYARADLIVLCMDGDGLTWSGNAFAIPESFFAWVADFDTLGKIQVYRDRFYVPGLTPIQCDTRQRNMLAQFMGPGGWHVQLDADEYFLDFGKFCDFLARHDRRKNSGLPVTIWARWQPLYKKVAGGFLFIDTDRESVPVATNRPEYTACRDTDQRKIFTPFAILHQSWARTEAEMRWKIRNWGHKDDFDGDAYLDFWKGIDTDNHATFHNIHPIEPATWPRLRFVPAADIGELIAAHDRKTLADRLLDRVRSLVARAPAARR